MTDGWFGFGFDMESVVRSEVKVALEVWMQKQMLVDVDLRRRDTPNI